jgi:hypothetical protein
MSAILARLHRQDMNLDNWPVVRHFIAYYGNVQVDGEIYSAKNENLDTVSVFPGSPGSDRWLFTVEAGPNRYHEDSDTGVFRYRYDTFCYFDPGKMFDEDFQSNIVAQLGDSYRGYSPAWVFKGKT